MGTRITEVVTITPCELLTHVVNQVKCSVSELDEYTSALSSKSAEDFYRAFYLK